MSRKFQPGMSRFKRLLFLGTSSGIPIPGKRNVSGAIVQFSCGRFILVDCGEGTQHQLMTSNVRMNRMVCVLITHLHGDHCYGLFGLLHTLNMSGRIEKLDIFGPRGLQELLDGVWRFTGGWNGFEICIHEISGDHAQTFTFPLSDAEIRITACPMVHRVPCYGYVITEAISPPKLDVLKARALGAEGPQLGVLKSGGSVEVTLEIGVSRLIKSEDVCFPAEQPRCLGILQDTSDARSAIPYLQNCTLVVHESTYESSQSAKAIEFGHSTTVMAGDFARSVHAEKLILTHFSAKYEDADLEKLRLEASAVSGCNVMVARDFAEFIV
jgi:ribonuclease Z